MKWIESYLCFRSHYVSIGTSNSSFRNITNGVPQGSVLGLILYVIYINKLPAVINDDYCTDVVHNDSEKLFKNNLEMWCTSYLRGRLNNSHCHQD